MTTLAEQKEFTNQIMPSGKSPGVLIQEFLTHVPVKPDRMSCDEEGNTGMEWSINGRVIQLEVAKNSAIGEWLTWLKRDPIEDIPFENIDLRESSTWKPLLELLTC